MTMKPIQNIINYNPEEMEEKLIPAKENLKKDDGFKQLKRKDIISLFFKFVYVACASTTLVVSVIISSIWFESLGCGEGIITVAQIIIFFGLFFLLAILAPKNFNAIYENKILEPFDELCASYCPDKFLFHVQVYNRNILVCYGELMDNSKFKVTVVTEAIGEDLVNRVKGLDESTVKRSYTFDYDGSNSDGILTLDVGNGRVFYA